MDNFGFTKSSGNLRLASFASDGKNSSLAQRERAGVRENRAAQLSEPQFPEYLGGLTTDS